MSKPNLIYIFADQLRHASVGYNGDRHSLTPGIDALRSQSIDLSQATSGHPVCAPYRASLFTGKYTTSTGMVINEIRMNTNHHTFADVLNENNYNTSYIGKWHMYANELGSHYESRNSFVPKGRDRLGFDDYFAHYNFRHEYQPGTAYYHLDTDEKIFYDKYEPDAQTDMAIDQLKNLSKSDKPFALFLSYGTPHDPWVPENVPEYCMKKVKDLEFELPVNYLPTNDPYADSWAFLSDEERAQLTEWIRCYYGMIINLDDNIGRLINEIEAMGLDENTIIVFTSDHGELFGAHGRRAKNIFYEEAVRVPFTIKWSEKIKENTSTDVVLNTVDIMPTLLSMMDLQIPDEVEGSDLSDSILHGTTIDKGALMMGTGPVAIFGDGYEWRAYRTNKYTYAIYRKDGSELLFDNIHDPYQQVNLINNSSYEHIKDDLRQKMLTEMNRVNDNFDANSYYEENWVKDRLIVATATL